MSLYDYKKGQELNLYCMKNHIPFYSVIQYAMRRADSVNLEKLKAVFPYQWEDLQRRYNAPGGILEEDK